MYSGGDYYGCGLGVFKEYKTIEELISFPGDFVDLFFIPGHFIVPVWIREDDKDENDDRFRIFCINL